MKDTYQLINRNSYEMALCVAGIYNIAPPILIYRIRFTCPKEEYDSYTQIEYIPENGKNTITSIDFDGGPKLSIGMIIGDAKIVGFISDNNFKEIKVLMEQIK